MTVRRASPTASRGKWFAPATRLLLAVALLFSAAVRLPAAEPPATAPASTSPAVPARQPAAGQTLTDSLGITFLRIPAGEFLMGAPDSETMASPYEKPQHRVQITRPFQLGVYEVTVGQFRRFAEAGGYRTDAEKAGDSRSWRHPLSPQTDRYPVTMVSWNDAAAFCAWLSRREGKSYRLPTEAEWEYACRAGTRTRYSFGESWRDLTDYAWYGGKSGNAGETTHAVGLKKPNPWGLWDMHGNVMEWCADWHGDGYYARSPTDDPAGPCHGDARMLRGGSWGLRPRDAWSASRNWYPPDVRLPDVGFRVVRVP